MANTKEDTPLLDANMASSAAMAGASVFNQAAEKFKKAKSDGPLTFRMLGFVGGWAMIVSNGLGIVDRFFSFNFPGALIAFWLVLFGVLSEFHVTWRFYLKSELYRGNADYLFSFKIRL
jgi:hypothetical protein